MPDGAVTPWMSFDPSLQGRYAYMATALRFKKGHMLKRHYGTRNKFR